MDCEHGICPICKENCADKKNVHLIPWFLIKNIITQDGSGQRDMELSFTIEANNPTKIFTGRSVLPEKGDEFGERNELEIERDNPYSRDYLICYNCEEKLSRLESIFALQFSQKKLLASFALNLPSINNNKIYTDKKYDSSLYELLIQSIFYRCSIGNMNALKLETKIEAKIENNLRSAFQIPGFKKILPTQQINLLHRFPLITCSFYTITDRDSTQGFITTNKSRYPYLIMAGQWLFQLFEAEKHLKSTIEFLHGLRDKINPFLAFNNIKHTAYIIQLEPFTSEFVYNNYLNFAAEKKGNGTIRNIRDFHFRIFGHRPSENIVRYINTRYYKYKNEGKNEFDCMVHAFFDLKELPLWTTSDIYKDGIRKLQNSK